MSHTLPLPSGVPMSDAFAPPLSPSTPLRAAISAACRRPEPECLAPLLAAATAPAALKPAIADTARALVTALRGKATGTGVEALVQEYALSSQEGVALMCLAEALLRIPDNATRDALIRDKIAPGDWLAHTGGGRSLFVNAASWGLVVTGKLTATVNETGLSAALTRLIARCGEPVIRRGVDMAMRMMGEHFVTGETIDEALSRARTMEAQGFRYSYDMLGEAAATRDDAARYLAAYETALHAIGRAAAGRSLYDGPGMSIKLSALHPRYSRAQAARVKNELLPVVKNLCLLAKSYGVGLNIDAEEADRLEISLDLLEALALDPDLSGWDGLGFVVQAYGKRCPFVLDWIIDLARRSGHRLMVRLVKGAYWDAEIKRAQQDGLADFPVFTRKVHTDVSYLACARKLLAARDAVFPQFATHNAQTLASVYHLAGPDFQVGDYEFQCLHGMGEPLYEEVVGKDRLNRPCRIYAPVGPHETLLAYLVRRLLENGANSSFVHRIADTAVSVEELAADPVETVLAMPVPGAPHDAIAAPLALYGRERRNAAGLDLSDEATLARLDEVLLASRAEPVTAAPLLADGTSDGDTRPVLNPADRRETVGMVQEASPALAARAMSLATPWTASAGERADALLRAADAYEQAMPALMALAVREAGKSAANAVAEVREAIDFLRYYAERARATLSEVHRPLGVVVCISPWNFPLAIFTGQVAAALAAGNAVAAKPAEETPLIAAEAVRLLHEAGVPRSALQLVTGDGRIGAALVGAKQTAGVMFTGSTEVARLIQASLSERLSPEGLPSPLIAETGGQNAMIVDSSALPEQVVADVLASAFDSAGQRCSALRVLCLQEEVADRILTLLKGAIAELSLGRPDKLATDVGPVITAEAQATIEAHIARMAQAGHEVSRLPLPPVTTHGTFVAPTLIEIASLAALEREVFGPVLHVLRYRRDDLDHLIDAINATGYGLTFGLHSRIDETMDRVSARVQAGNLYINRNMIGAVVGVQPFGGRGLSGTGPKAGGPLYLHRLVRGGPPAPLPATGHSDPAAGLFADWLAAQGYGEAADAVHALAQASRLGVELTLPGPVGEKNLYALHPRGTILLCPQTMMGLFTQIGAVLATGNAALIEAPAPLAALLDGVPQSLAVRLKCVDEGSTTSGASLALAEGDATRMCALARRIARWPGAVVPVITATQDGWPLDALLEEVVVSTNTAAAGGNASLMAIG